MSPEVLELKKLIDESDSIVFFGGAGVSTGQEFQPRAIYRISEARTAYITPSTSMVIPRRPCLATAFLYRIRTYFLTI